METKTETSEMVVSYWDGSVWQIIEEKIDLTQAVFDLYMAL